MILEDSYDAEDISEAEFSALSQSESEYEPTQESQHSEEFENVSLEPGK